MNMPLNRRVLILVLIPSLLISFFFVFWFGSQQLRNDRDALDLQLSKTAERLQNSLEFGLITGNKPLLEAIAKVALNEENVRSISIVNADREWILQIGPTPFVAADISFNDSPVHIEGQNSLTIISPSLHTNVVYYPTKENIQINPHWLILELSKDRLLVKRYQTILIDLVLLLLATATSVLVSLGITRLIIVPIDQMSSELRKMVSGDSRARIPATGVTEMQEIGDNVNKLANALETAYIDLQTGIDQATHDIRETLETLEIQNIELDMARREAIDASRIKSEFLSNMSHEIRTPLNGIIGFANLLNKTHLSRKQEDFARTIQLSSQNLLTIINDILDFAKIEAGKLSLDNTQLNLKTAVEEVLVMIAPEAHLKHIELIPMFYQDVPQQIIGDPLRIKQIITNLVGNAIKFTNAGQVSVRITLENDFATNVTIRIAITDTGIGLNEVQKKALFKAFQQANTSTAREYGGTGLGLIICKKLVEQMGGDMGIESEPGQGSTFWFTFRAKVADTQIVPALPETAPKTILLYDVNKTMQLTLRRTIEALDMRVVEADNLSQWVTLACGKKVDMAIVGFNTTADVGESLHNGLAAIKKASGTTTMVLTNGFEDSIGMKLIEQHANVCLSKPFRSEHFMKILTQSSVNQDDDDDIRKVYQTGGRILAVDDNESNLKLISVLIEDHGIEAVAVNSGQKAIDLLETNTFDLVFMDIQMPIMDGIETTMHIRQMKSQLRNNTPIIAVTAHALDSEREHLLRNGFDDYLTKPLSDASLLTAISHWTPLRFEESQLKANTINGLASLPSQDDNDIIVDIPLALKRANQKPDLAIDMFESLVDQCALDIAKIKSCYDNNDTKGLLEIVHKLHGATHYCGVPQLKFRTEVVEVLLKSGEYQNIEETLDALFAAIQAVLDWNDNHDFADNILSASVAK